MIYLIIFLYTWLIGIIMYLNFNFIRGLSFVYLIILTLSSFFLLMILNKSIIWYQLIYKFYTLNYIYISYIIGMIVFQLVL